AHLSIVPRKPSARSASPALLAAAARSRRRRCSGFEHARQDLELALLHHLLEEPEARALPDVEDFVDLRVGGLHVLKRLPVEVIEPLGWRLEQCIFDARLLRQPTQILDEALPLVQL